MKGSIVALCLLLLALCVGCGADAKGKDAEQESSGLHISQKNREEAQPMEKRVKSELTELYHVMWKALLEKDIPKLDQIHDEDFVLVHMTGMHQSKAEYLRCVRDGELNYFTETTEHVYIELVSEDRAILTGQSKVEAAVFGGSRNTWSLQLVFGVEKKNGEWILTGAKASTY